MNKVLGILLVLLMLALSGCIDEKKDTSLIPTATPQPETENIGLDIDITSYSRMFIPQVWEIFFNLKSISSY
jgi:hypothetical protein